jgi:hypothetical protein
MATTTIDKLTKLINILPDGTGLAIKKLIAKGPKELTQAQYQLIQKGLSEKVFQEWLTIHNEIDLEQEETELLLAWLNSEFVDKPHLYEGWKQNELKRRVEVEMRRVYGFPE